MIYTGCSCRNGRCQTARQSSNAAMCGEHNVQETFVSVIRNRPPMQDIYTYLRFPYMPFGLDWPQFSEKQ